MDFKNKILHIAVWDKFIPSYISFVKENFNLEEHLFFIITGNGYVESFQESRNVIKVKSWRKLILPIVASRKVILHGMFSNKLIFLLFLLYPYLYKFYWVMWGGDIYFDLFPSQGTKMKLIRNLRIAVIRRLKHFVTGIPGDYLYLQSRYGVSGRVYHCMGYLSNVFEIRKYQSLSQKKLVLVGNSATRSNNHLSCFQEIRRVDPGDIEIVSPLSYGDKEYARDVAKMGKEFFRDRFTPLCDFIPYEDYLKLLETIQFAILNQTRQQSVGSIIQLLGMGTKIYMNESSTHFRFFKDHGFFIFSLQELNFERLNLEQIKKNRELAEKLFSRVELFKQWKNIFEGSRNG